MSGAPSSNHLRRYRGSSGGPVFGTTQVEGVARRKRSVTSSQSAPRRIL
jgi:hypothetical protein